MKLQTSIALGVLVSLTTAQNLTTTDYGLMPNSTFSTEGTHDVRYDTGIFGPPVEEFHYYHDQWPIGLAVSSTNRTFVCYTRGTYAYTIGEVVNQTAEAAYPSLELNTVPGGLYNTVEGIQFGSNNSNYFISVQALYVTPDDTLWVLDTGRPSINESRLQVCRMLRLGDRNWLPSIYQTIPLHENIPSSHSPLCRLIYVRLAI